MENEKRKAIGFLGVAAYIILIIGILGFVLDVLFIGEHSERGEWISYEDKFKYLLFNLGLALILYVIDRIRNKKYDDK
jgi:hypothetical protein